MHQNPLNFYGDTDYSADASQTITLDAGTYTFSPSIQGGDTNASSDLAIYATINGQTKSVKVAPLTGWKKWLKPELTFSIAKQASVKLGIKIKSNAKSWGTTDDWILTKIANSDTDQSGSSSSQASKTSEQSASSESDTLASSMVSTKSTKNDVSSSKRDKTLPRTGEKVMIGFGLVGIVMLASVCVIYFKHQAS